MRRSISASGQPVQAEGMVVVSMFDDDCPAQDSQLRIRSTVIEQLAEGFVISGRGVKCAVSRTLEFDEQEAEQVRQGEQQILVLESHIAFEATDRVGQYRIASKSASEDLVDQVRVERLNAGHGVKHPVTR